MSHSEGIGTHQVRKVPRRLSSKSYGLSMRWLRSLCVPMLMFCLQCTCFVLLHRLMLGCGIVLESFCPIIPKAKDVIIFSDVQFAAFTRLRVSVWSRIRDSSDFEIDSTYETTVRLWRNLKCSLFSAFFQTRKLRNTEPLKPTLLLWRRQEYMFERYKWRCSLDSVVSQAAAIRAFLSVFSNPDTTTVPEYRYFYLHSVFIDHSPQGYTDVI